MRTLRLAARPAYVGIADSLPCCLRIGLLLLCGLPASSCSMNALEVDPNQWNSTQHNSYIATACLLCKLDSCRWEMGGGGGGGHYN